MVSPLPVRPRLAEHVHCARRVVGDRLRVSLTDFRAGIRVEIDEPRYLVLTFADGTRDLDGLCLASAKAGIYGGEAGIRELLLELHANGLLRDGLAPPARRPPVETPEVALERPLEALPGYRFACDGSGSCCRLYGMVAFSEAEARRARVVADELALPLAPEQAFTPMTGALRERGQALVVAQVDGRCLFLEGDARCGLHRMGGPAAKPYPCRTFPTTLVDDGVRMRVSVAPECKCAFRSVGGAGGEPLVPAGAERVSDLPAGVPWIAVPDPVPLTLRRTASRAAARAWSDALLTALTAVTDAPAALFGLADAIVPSFADPGAVAALLTSPPPLDAARANTWLAALARRAVEVAARQAAMRSASDLNVRVARWIADSLEGADASTLATAAHDLEAERFYLRALVFGYRLSAQARPLAHGLVDRAVRLLAARAMAARPLADPAARPALALLEAAMRNLTLTDYADHLGDAPTS